MTYHRMRNDLACGVNKSPLENVATMCHTKVGSRSQCPCPRYRRKILCLIYLARLPKRPMAVDLLSIQGLVDTLRECVRELNVASKIDESLAGLVGDSVTQGAYPVLYLARRGELERASRLLVTIWKTTLQALDPAAESLASEQGSKPNTLEAELEYLSALNVAVSEVLHLDVNQAEARNVLRHLASNLELSFDELGRMFGVSGETVRRWERGTHRIPTGRIAKLISANHSVSRLLQMFRSNRLPQVIRREVDLFGGERALDWILRGRHADVADRYENTLMYQA